MKKWIIGLFVLLIAVCGMAQDNRSRINFTFGQNVNDTHKSLAMGIGVEIPLTNHLFFQFGYHFSPDYFKQFFNYYQSEGHFAKFYGGYRMSLGSKISLAFKGGFCYYHIQEQGRNYYNNEWHYNELNDNPQVGVALSAGANFIYLTSSNINLLWGIEYISYIENVVAYVGFAFNL